MFVVKVIVKKEIWIKLGLFVFFWCAVAITLRLKLGNAWDMIYAEDGAVYIQQAIDLPFPKDVFTAYAGYSDLTARLIGNFVSLFDVQHYTKIILLSVSFILACIGFVTFKSTRNEIRTFSLRLILTFGLILIPIGNFESIGNITNLHFYLMSACVFLLFGQDKRNKHFILGSFLILLACLSTPLMVFYIPLILGQFIFFKLNKLPFRLNAYHISLLLGIFLQGIFVITRALGDRKITSDFEYQKTLFLFLDRVIGSTVIPFWGFVSGENLNSDTYTLWIRAVIALFILLMILFFYLFTHMRKIGDVTLSFCLISGAFLYWFFIGIFFAPEPRYAIFASYLFLASVLTLVDKILHKTQEAWLIMTICTLFFSTWIGSFNPSHLRTTGITVSQQIKTASLVCDKENSTYSIRLLPLNAMWQLKLSCKT